MRITGSEEENKTVIDVARLMLLAARTAPKGRGIDELESMILTGKEKDAVAKEMYKISKDPDDHWARDAKSVEACEALVLIGLKGPKALGTQCGACGYANCGEMLKVGRKEGHLFAGPTCIIKTLDMGIAIGSAVKTAQIHNVDNRIIYRVGVVAKQLKILDESDIIMGIPLAVMSKSPFFDR